MSDELDELRSFKAVVTRALSHDIKNPLGGLISTLDAILEMTDPGSPAGNLAAIALAGARGSMRIASTLVFWSKLRAGTYEMEPVPLEPAAAIAATVELLKGSAEANGQMLKTLVAPGIRAVMADGPLVYCALENLVAYAMKFAPRGTEILIGAAPARGGVAVFVSDAGPVITPEMQKRLFDIETAADAPGRERGSFGPGLAFAALAAKAHGGSLTVESSGGPRTTFTLTLPSAGR